MKVTFKKRRYYKGKLREPGQVVDMDQKHARAFIRVNAAVPTVTEAEKEEKEALKRTKVTAVAPVADPVVEPDVEIEEVEELPELEEVTEPESDELSYRELQEKCKERDLPAGGSKEDLIKRLEEGE